MEKGNKEYEMYEYINAQKTYLKVAKRGYRSEELFSKLGNTFYFNGEYEEAVKWYKKLIMLYGGNVESEYYYRYAQTLKSVGDYDNANLYLRVFAKLNPQDKRAQLFLENQTKEKKRKELEKEYSISNLLMNSSDRDFGASYYKDFVIFSSSRNGSSTRDTTKVHEWNKEHFLDMYMSRFDYVSGELYEAEKWNLTLSSDLHESTPVFTKDFKTVYFTGSAIEKGSYWSKNRNEVKTNELKIYRSEIDQNGKWSKPLELHFCSDLYSTAHPMLNSDETKLYFSSDMPGGKGESDIYEVTINEDGTLGEPLNLGEMINTEGKETFPFVSTDGKLYFSSDGHVGLGGLDVFVTSLKDLKDGNAIVINLGKPINGAADDFGFVLHDDMEKGYFSSNRLEGKGKDDLYAFIDLELSRQKNCECEEDSLRKGDDLAKKLLLNPIYFDLDKSFIRLDATLELDRIVDIMEEYPNMKIDIRSHTDSRALNWYNNRLSTRRANSTRMYLIRKGISPDRLTSKGYGETELLNHCDNGVECSEDEHQLNRRSEFIIMQR